MTKKERVRAHPFKAKATGEFLVRRLKTYFRENPGAFFIVQFQILLVACACLLVQGNSAAANEVAVYGYYLLVIGLVLQVVAFARSGKDKKTSEQVRAFIDSE